MRKESEEENALIGNKGEPVQSAFIRNALLYRSFPYLFISFLHLLSNSSGLVGQRMSHLPRVNRKLMMMFHIPLGPFGLTIARIGSTFDADLAKTWRQILLCSGSCLLEDLRRHVSGNNSLQRIMLYQYPSSNQPLIQAHSDCQDVPSVHINHRSDFDPGLLITPTLSL